MEDDEFLATLRQVRVQLHQELKSKSGDDASSSKALKSAKAEVLSLRGASEAKDAVIAEQKKQILALEADVKVDGGRGSVVDELAALKAQIASLEVGRPYPN